MGMFDYLRCRYPLPNPDHQDLEFQTKSFPGPALEQFEITPDGRLLIQTWNEMNYTGEISFHDFTPNKEWVEYCAVFLHGRLQSITEVSGEK